jgi:glycosyltransferase 2 family protein
VRPRRSTVALAVGAVASIVFAYLAVRDTDLDRFWDGLRHTDYIWLAPSLAALGLAVLIRAQRWRLLFSEATRPPLGAATRALLVGYLLNNILPARAGDAVRAFFLHREARTSRAEALGTVVTERVYDVVALLAILFVAAPFLPEVTWLTRAVYFAVGVGVVMLAAGVVLARYGPRPARFLLRPLARIPGTTTGDIEQAASNLTAGLDGLHRPRLVVTALAMTSLSWVVVAVANWCLLVGFHLDAGLGAGFLVLITTGLATMLPSLPAGIGVFEAATVLALSAYGIDDSRALSYAVVLHGVNFFPYFLFAYLLVPRQARAALRGR